LVTIWPAASQTKPVPDCSPPPSPPRLRRLESGGVRYHLYDRRRDLLKQRDGRALDVRKIAARLDRARRGSREQESVDIGLADIDAEDDKKRNQHDPSKPVAHCGTPNLF
jgi:hypothetical protein